MPGYIDGMSPLVVTTLEATVVVQSPYIQASDTAGVLEVPDPGVADELAVLSSVQTMSSKTFLNPVITSGLLTQPVVTSGLFSAPTIDTALIKTPDIRMTGGGTMTGGITHNVIGGTRVVKTQAAGATKTLDLSTADIFIVELTQSCTLTISNAGSSKLYHVVVKQNVTNSFTGMSWMTGFVNPLVASGPTQSTSAVDFWEVLYDAPAGKHYAFGAKDVQT